MEAKVFRTLPLDPGLGGAYLGLTRDDLAYLIVLLAGDHGDERSQRVTTKLKKALSELA